MSDIRKHIQNAAATAGRRAYTPSNSPAQYQTRQRQYYDSETALFTEEYAKYASDYVKAQAQGLNAEDPTLWETVYMRFADIGKATATSTKKSDDYKRILLANRVKDYIRPGTKFVTMGSTWLAINPNNMSGVGAGGVVQRCNAVWNYLDWYGNVQSEPIAVDRYLSRANGTDTQEAMNLAKGYFDVKCQKNAATEQLGENSRMILGRNCYRITGFSDFIQEFTGDYSTVRMLEFSIYYEEPNYTIDDMENHVAGGKEFSWTVNITGKNELTAEETAQWQAGSVRNGESVTGTEEHPITYLWSSSDENVATVDEYGAVTAVGAGTCEITATLAQNASWTAQMAVTVAAAEDKAVRFMQTVPETISAYDEITVTAGYFESGTLTEQTVEWTFSGADEQAYTADVNGNTAVIHCWGSSVTPLTVTAACEGVSSSTEIRLEGF